MEGNCFILPIRVILCSTFLILLPLAGNCGELGTVECSNGKWKVDTRLMALVMTCPLPLDGNTESIMKMAKCAMNKLGIYDGQNLSDDYLETACSVFSQKKLREECIDKAGTCAILLMDSWETTWPLFAGCFVPWAMGICNI
ncbi:unnamed protein product [Orchesella dallaii]|uniref:Uncharacterized protein n=1 Tax=Orchesella dallaii TaxID=48710 RepID=A0ABP1RLG2_9HEXA